LNEIASYLTKTLKTRAGHLIKIMQSTGLVNTVTCLFNAID